VVVKAGTSAPSALTRTVLAAEPQGVPTMENDE
jgi:hypothetical protein